MIDQVLLSSDGQSKQKDEESEEELKSPMKSETDAIKTEQIEVQFEEHPLNAFVPKAQNQNTASRNLVKYEFEGDKREELLEADGKRSEQTQSDHSFDDGFEETEPIRITKSVAKPKK